MLKLSVQHKIYFLSKLLNTIKFGKTLILLNNIALWQIDGETQIHA